MKINKILSILLVMMLIMNIYSVFRIEKYKKTIDNCIGMIGEYNILYKDCREQNRDLMNLIIEYDIKLEE